jgi:hypothetical protein
VACGCWRHGLLEQFCDFCLEYLTLFRAKTAKPERLQIAVQPSHRKQHFGLGAQNAGTNRKRQVNLGSLVHVHSEFQQPSRDGELMEFGWNTPETFELN